MIYGVIALLVLVIIIQLVYADRLDERRRKYADELCDRWIAERDGWHIERQQLLDRIQAPSYDVMKHHEVKIIKAQNNEKEPPKLEVL
jgi:adenylate kinase